MSRFVRTVAQLEKSVPNFASGIAMIIWKDSKVGEVPA